jgi:S1-C subfamily serine protease
VEVKSSRPRGGVIIVVVVILLIVAAGAYYESTVTGFRSSLSSQVSSLRSQVTNLEQTNSNLQSLLASTSTSISNQSVASPEGIYSAYSRSVVTVLGYELITQNTFFGQVTSVASVQGSGFVVSIQNSSYIVTNNHVVNGVSNITVTFSDGNSYPATVKGTDGYRDLAVLSVSAPNSEFHPLKVLGLAGAVTVGETVYAIGSPFGLSGSMTIGIVSQVGRTITESTSTQVSIPDVIQFSAAINPGNSGGPLLDSNGEVIGITTAAVSNSEGLGFAIPAATLARELSSLVSVGSYALHPLLGISSSADVNFQVAQSAGSNVTYGVLVQSVSSGGAAAQAGIHGGTKTVAIEGQNYLLGGDIIVSVNGSKVVDMDALASYLEEHAVGGQTVQLGLIRSGAYVTVNLVLGAQ